MTLRDSEFLRLFTWAFGIFNARLRSGVPKRFLIPDLMTGLLTVEGVRDKLLLQESSGQIPADLCDVLRSYRKLRHIDRTRVVTRLLPYWSNPK
jgi:hypothetical protein